MENFSNKAGVPDMIQAKHVQTFTARLDQPSRLQMSNETVLLTVLSIF
jgi:hypothetical protein